MKETNIISIVHAKLKLNALQCKEYYNYLNINPKDVEVKDLETLIRQIKIYNLDLKIFDNYFFGYTIPQIGKEFDLLRFGDNYTVNIELKSADNGGAILKQLERNEYYLSFLNEKIYCFTYVSKTNKLYSLDSKRNLVEIKINVLAQILYNQVVAKNIQIDKLFDPSNYLVSPFNSTLKFITGEYFLTQQQEDFKGVVNKNILTPNASFTSICGKAGTGKTLLTYDIAKDYINNSKKVLIIHIGILNQGQHELIDNYNWDITSIRNIDYNKLSNYDLIIIDETQRIRPPQLEFIIKSIKSNGKNCIFSYDINQCLRAWETNNNIDVRIENLTASKVLRLTNKIRTNKEVASFIKCLFDKNEVIHKLDRSNIELNYFSNVRTAKRFAEKLKDDDWKIINYTPSTRDTHPYEDYSILSADTAHKIIGQEFEKVAVIIDSYFYYKGNELSVKNNGDAYYYNPQKMLFQMVTRARKKLNVIIINNGEVMERCLAILNK